MKPASGWKKLTFRERFLTITAVALLLAVSIWYAGAGEICLAYPRLLHRCRLLKAENENLAAEVAELAAALPVAGAPAAGLPLAGHAELPQVLERLEKIWREKPSLQVAHLRMEEADGNLLLRLAVTGEKEMLYAVLDDVDQFPWLLAVEEFVFRQQTAAPGTAELTLALRLILEP